MEEKNGQKLLNLTTDLVFKIFFKKNIHLLQALIGDFLPFPEDSEIIDIELQDAEKNSPDIADPQEKTFILDLKVRLERKSSDGDTERNTVNVEVQTVARKSFTNRLLAYSGRIYSGQVKKGEDYDTLLPVYSLVFTTVNLKEFASLKDEYYHHCLMLRRKPPHLTMTEGIQFVVVELGKFVKSLEKVLDQRDSWCYLLSRAELMDQEDLEALKKKGGVMGEAVRKLWDLSQDELIRERLDAAEKQRRDRVAEREYARDEGIDEGLEKGIKKVALTMIRSGFDLDTISFNTGLSKSELEKLSKELKK